MKDIIKNFYFDYYDLDIDLENIGLKLMEYQIDEICAVLLIEKREIRLISAANIPQFSNVEIIPSVLQIIDNAGKNQIDYEYIGDKLNKSYSQSAKIKYGENHVKLAIQMGLAMKSPYRVSDLGKMYLLMKKDNQIEISRKLFLRIPIIQRLLTESADGEINAMDELKKYLSPKTAIRRRSNVKRLLFEISKGVSEPLCTQISEQIKWNELK